MMTKFWYESNACWGHIKTLEDLQEKCKLQIGEFGTFLNVDQFLDRSRQNKNGSLDFGTREEHTGDKSLRTYLIEIGMLDEFLQLINSKKTSCKK